MTERDNSSFGKTVLKKHCTAVAQVTYSTSEYCMQLKTLFAQKVPDMSFTNTTSMVEQQLKMLVITESNAQMSK
jgi:hypothetical protein